ncbi:MAG: sodium-dependent bicarbonate transport family permease [Candidatus Sumerlaeaceae bacterium]|nr:sodium-dependent bicarbonate transport family permease [Candidatus Sumerlaeaceae bacterium]
MDLHLILSNLLSPPVLFFFLGAAAVLAKSDLDFPQPIPKLFSLYLLMAIGFKGGVELRHSGLTVRVVVDLVAAMAMALAVPVVVFYGLRKRLGEPNAAAVSATYGSVSAVTFIAGTALLTRLGIEYGGHMVAALALMESPAIVVAVALFRLSGKTRHHMIGGWKHLLKEALFNGSVFLLVGSLLIGIVSGAEGEKALRPFVGDIFKGMLCLFLLDMGLVSARRLAGLKALGAAPVVFAIVIPLCSAMIALVLSRLLGMDQGEAFLFTVLCASGSYIAVPAAMRLSIPEANPGLYVTMAIGITFPFNMLIGLPLYLAIIKAIWSH